MDTLWSFPPPHCKPAQTPPACAALCYAAALLGLAPFYGTRFHGLLQVAYRTAAAQSSTKGKESYSPTLTGFGIFGSYFTANSAHRYAAFI